ncbi:beta-galactosidase [Candidatus Uhrbacteria bacterium]|nr:beta-galactosidase [Candidatus Uhrbacteria bacterium]
MRSKKEKITCVRPRRMWWKKFLKGSIWLCALVFIVLNFPAQKVSVPTNFGVTFSPWQATSFGLDWKETYIALLDDLGVRLFRLSAYWDMIEIEDNTYTFEEMDFQLDEAEKRGAKVILAVGRKLPRWPECHDPKWIQGLSRAGIEREALEQVRQVVLRYRNHPAVARWQVENELFFPFGICPNFLGIDSLKREVALVRSLDSRPIVVTDAGEWTAWFPAALYGDILGSSLYREAWNTYLGNIPFPVTPGYYQLKNNLILKPLGKQVIFTELQAEPWGPKGVQEMTNAEMLQYMPIQKIQNNIRFARAVGFNEVYLWGGEWWYALKKHGESSVWDAMREVYQN